MKRLTFYIIIVVIILLPLCSAAHYIIGFVEDARDTTTADGHSIILWNNNIGIQDNLSDIIGSGGNSGINNGYSIDCELLNTPCVEGNILTLKVINNGDNYISEEKNITISAVGPDSLDNITLNSPPISNLIYPISFANISNNQVDFNCSVLDLDDNLKEVSLYENWSGEWILNETKEITFGDSFIIFNKNLPQGTYKYAYKVTDNLSIFTFSDNNTFNVDLTKPIIESVFVNISSSCGKSNIIRVNCTTYDEFTGIKKVLVQTVSPSETKNYSSFLLTGNTYYVDILLNESGNWIFTCFSNDSAGNMNSLTSEEVKVYSGLPEIYVNFTNINLSKSAPIENENVTINAVIENFGCVSVENVLIGFFEGDPDNYGDNIGNTTVNIGENSFVQTNIPWNAKIGPTNLFVFADYNLSINEENESNNKANKTISINSWQEIYGNTSVNKIIGGDSLNIKKWLNESNLQGNIFITDSECSVDWLSLQAIGKSKIGVDSTNDFLEIDELLNMTIFEDSVSNLFSEYQNPRETKEMIIYQKEIQGIPIINSTNNSNFVTGILWDYSDDREGPNGEFDLSDKEDVIFVAEINKLSYGAYGIYDYEIKIPSRLREYNNLNSEEIYLYYNLV